MTNWGQCLEVACPTCAAKVGKVCTAGSGARSVVAHAARRKLYYEKPLDVREIRQLRKWLEKNADIFNRPLIFRPALPGEAGRSWPEPSQ